MGILAVILTAGMILLALSSSVQAIIHSFIHSIIYLMLVRKIICRKLQFYFLINTYLKAILNLFLNIIPILQYCLQKFRNLVYK